MSDDVFAPPPFKPDAALVDLKRRLRDLRELAERGPAFQLRGLPVVELAVAGDAIEARLAKRPAQVPEWTTHRIGSAAELRKFVDAVRLQLGRWRDE